MDSKTLRENFNRYLTNFLAKDEATATSYDRYLALAYAVRSELMEKWIETQKRYHERNVRRLYYLSTEYNLGKNLLQNMLHLGIESGMTQAVKSLGFSIEDLYAEEDDYQLGNVSEERITVCLLDALASQGYPAMAYGIRYDYGQFNQEIRNGVQTERPNDWMRRGNPWEILRLEYTCTVKFGGKCRILNPSEPLGPYEWNNSEIVHAIPYDLPLVGYRNGTVNTLRLWSARLSEQFLPDYLNHGDYERAFEDKSKYGRITQLLFPDEDVRRATDLRMKQQYFFICASLQDIIRRFKQDGNAIQDFDKKVAVHISGSCCALAIPEMMRLLVDKEGVPWGKAWEMTRVIFSYTSQALFKEDTEIWPVYKVGQILPRHLQIIFDLNQIHLDEVRTRCGSDSNLVRELSLIEEGEVKRIRFADLAVLGSNSINGVSGEQTENLKNKVFPYLAGYFTDRFSCRVNGIGQRRWLMYCNRPLSQLLTKYIGEQWITKPDQLQGIEKHLHDDRFLQAFSTIKREAKRRLAEALKQTDGFTADESMLFDVQLGKIHVNKRQLLHVLYVLHCYLAIRQGEKPCVPRFHIFGGKASPSDFLAKQIIHLIWAVAERINADEAARGLLKVSFIPNAALSWAERIAPAVDLSEQLSTAGMESCGTFSMKFALNGAVTIASRSGANIEMARRIGEGNIFTFGHDLPALSSLHDYRPTDLLARDERLKTIFSFLEDEVLPRTVDGHAIHPLLSALRDSDRHFVLLDFDDYIARQKQVDALYRDPIAWLKTSLTNLARIGWFMSDRIVQEYARDIWKVAAV
ncbi:MAG: glycogen/starch/alpha-glucan family phosphorylase [Chitinispirillaceae bacterium]|jgi:starch phosphorylase